MMNMRKWFLPVLLVMLVNTVAAQQTPRPPAPPPDGTPAANTGLTGHQIFLAYSEDGLIWRFDDTVIRDSASVPALFYWQATLWILAVNGTADENFERLVMLTQSDDGAWSEQFIETDLPGRPVDPDVVVLPDGRLRLFVFDFTANEMPPRPGDTTPRTGSIYSAISEDGKTFTAEAGIRLSVTPPATDPDMVQQDEDTWWLFVSHPASPNHELVIARSSDGITFEESGMTTNGNISDTVLLEDGTLRQYVCTPQGMQAQESPDGLAWKLMTGTKLPPGCDPNVVQMPDGTWAMVYKRIKP